MTYLGKVANSNKDVLLSVYVKNYGVKICMQKMLDKIMYSNSGKFFGKSKEKFSLGIEQITSSMILIPET